MWSGCMVWWAVIVWCEIYAVVCPAVALLAYTVIMEAYTFICCDLLYSFDMVLSAVIGLLVYMVLLGL